MNTEVGKLSSKYGVRYDGISYARFTAYASYRIALGFEFENSLDPMVAVKPMVSRLLLEIQKSLVGDFSQTAGEEFLGEALFEVDSRSGATRALLIWKDHPCLARDVDRAIEEVIQAALKAFISVCGKPDDEHPPKCFFTLGIVAEKLINDEEGRRLDRYLSGGSELFEASDESLG